MKRHSLHIGIDHYDDNAFFDLQFCTADAELLASFFRDVAGYKSVSQLDNPTRGAILDAVSEEASRLNHGDLLVLTYSGHGLRLQGGFGIVASDSRYELVQTGIDGLPLDILTKRIRKAGVNLAVFLDSCPTENAVTRGIFGRTSTCGPSSLDLFQGTALDDRPSLSIMGMGPGFSLEIPALGHGLFTLALDRALRELHAQGEATITHICERTDEHMKVLCREYAMPSPPHVHLTQSGGFESGMFW